VVASSNLPAVGTLSFDDVLFNTLVCSWNELMPEAGAGQVQIEYHVGPAGSVEFVKVWGATIRGHWDLICEHWMSSGISNQGGLRFANGHKPGTFGALLNSIMQQQQLFRVGAAPGTNCMIQVSPPTDQERISALEVTDSLR
jgi:hypothetical protein